MHEWEDRQRLGVMRVDDDEEDDRVEEQMDGDDIEQLLGPGEDDGLDQREGNREERSPRLIAQLPEERHEDDRLEQIGDRAAEVPHVEHVTGADEEQLVPEPDRVDPHEESRDLIRFDGRRPVPIDARGEEVERHEGFLDEKSIRGTLEKLLAE